ncbi:MAG: hypothetical protein N4A37_01485 [Prolixibacteraceae bacterium]|jgi:ABC-type proline/glycine betaine transport system substrate-binding protein|nr:hypothetical protein [Prolixibacteraceae bacterium]
MFSYSKKITFLMFFVGVLSLISCTSNSKKRERTSTSSTVVHQAKPKKLEDMLIESKDSCGTRVAVSKFMDAIVLSNIMNLELHDAGTDWNFHFANSTIKQLLDGEADLTMMVWEYHNNPTIEKEHPSLKFISSISTNAREGFVVPEYTGVLSINEVKKNLDSFVDTIYVLKGLYDIRMETEQIVKTYNLPMTIKLCDEQQLLSDMVRLYKNKKGFIASGWYPSLMFGLMDLNMIDRPDKKASERVDINIYATKKWYDSHKKEAAMLKKIRLDSEFYSMALDVMMKNRNDLAKASKIIYRTKGAQLKAMVQR